MAVGIRDRDGIDGDARIARSVLDTSLLPENARIGVWRETAASVWEISAITDATFFAQVDAYHAGDLMFGSVVSCSQKTQRDAALIASDSLDYFLMQFYVEGSRVAKSRGKEQVLSNGDMLMVDMSQPIETDSTAYKSVDLVMPRRVLEPLLIDPDAHAGQRLMASDPLTALFRAHLMALYQAAPHMTEAQAFSVQGATLALAAAALNGTISPEHANSVRAAAWLPVRKYIEENLSDLRLSAEQTALAFGISRATLYRMMEHRGGFANYLRQRRLYRCRDDLVKPENVHRSIADIAALWGFPNPSSFTVMFKEQFDMGPRDFRQLARGRVRRISDSGSESDWSRWLAAMR
ncbi:helix-turn-helix domain-containing protein [uncultured Brevundimonas sp.]|uniref:helix-turn-helix domain-containing protein n=1 Tax=uncultured Brevundimonas sp. TaxID=213418 RepID=UPI002620E3BB|nr:helix-turn-helix domain-containing protein [uncultured Brevundimonas sp.]